MFPMSSHGGDDMSDDAPAGMSFPLSSRPGALPRPDGAFP
jgi:hypothetical protein